MLRTRRAWSVAAALATVLLLTNASSALAAPVDLTNVNFEDTVRQRPEDSWMVFELFASW